MSKFGEMSCKVTLHGVILKKRVGKAYTFLSLQCEKLTTDDVKHIPQDSSIPIQCVAVSSDVSTLSEFNYVALTGTIQKLPEGKRSGHPFEFKVESHLVLGPCDSEFMSKCPSDAGSEIKLKERHLYLRDPQMVLKTRLRAKLLTAMRDYFASDDVLEIVPPSFTGVECEGGATLFKVEHPGQTTTTPMTAFLTQSSQFALEYALPGVGDCYCIAPSFRAEHSVTRRHLTEFLHAEAEWKGILTMEDHLDKLTDMLKGIIARFVHLADRELTAFGCKEHTLKCLYMASHIVVLEHKDAIEECRKRGIKKDDGSDFGDREDIPEAQERALIDAMDSIVYLIKFPKEFKSFYMLADPVDESRVLGCDVEVPGVGEVIGSGIREYRYDVLVEKMKLHGLKVEDYREYLDLRKYGARRTSGMGLGVDRFLVWLLGLQSIREVVAFPRFPGYLRP